MSLYTDLYTNKPEDYFRFCVTQKFTNKVIDSCQEQLKSWGILSGNNRNEYLDSAVNCAIKRINRSHSISQIEHIADRFIRSRNIRSIKDKFELKKIAKEFFWSSEEVQQKKEKIVSESVGSFFSRNRNSLNILFGIQ